MDFLLEKFVSAGCFEEVKEYKGATYEEVKEDVESMLGKCKFVVTGIDSPFTLIKPWLTDGEYRLICYGEN